MLSAIYIIIFTVIAAGIVAYAQYTFKKAIPKFKFNLEGVMSLISNRKILAGCAIYVFGFAFYLVALSSGQLSFVYPAFSSTFIFVILISHFKLHEKIGYARLGGMALIILGIALVSGVI